MKHEGIRYLIIGVLTTLINIGIYQGCLLLNSPYGLATTIAFMGSVAFAYYYNAGYVFKTKTNLLDMIKFYGSRVSTFLVETLGLVVLITFLHSGEMVSKWFMNGIIIVLNYVISKFWIFKGDKNEEVD